MVRLLVYIRKELFIVMMVPQDDDVFKMRTISAMLAFSWTPTQLLSKRCRLDELYPLLSSWHLLTVIFIWPDKHCRSGVGGIAVELYMARLHLQVPVGRSYISSEEQPSWAEAAGKRQRLRANPNPIHIIIFRSCLAAAPNNTHR